LSAMLTSPFAFLVCSLGVTEEPVDRHHHLPVRLTYKRRRRRLFFLHATRAKESGTKERA
jgi:hypothetical protein